MYRHFRTVLYRRSWSGSSYELVIHKRRYISSFTRIQRSRGVQCVHWVMHKCIMVKVGGKRNTHKVCKKQLNFSKTGEKLFKLGGNNNFRGTGGKCTETGKIGGNSKFVVDD